MVQAPGSRHHRPMPPHPSPTDERLRETIAERMRMSPIDQPLMLMELLGHHSPAPAQDIARRILGEDVTQIEYYTERVKRMVGRVLTGNGITHYGDGLYSLIATAMRCGPKAQPSKIQAADQLFDRAAHLAGHVLEDLPQGANPQGLVGRNREVLLLAGGILTGPAAPAARDGGG